MGKYFPVECYFFSYNFQIIRRGNWHIFYVIPGKEFSSMAFTVSDHLIQRLQEWGIKRIFGYPGDGINGIMESLNKVGDKMEFIQVRHEENAAFMACGHAKFTEEPGVCLATSGPGAIHLL